MIILSPNERRRFHALQTPKAVPPSRLSQPDRGDVLHAASAPAQARHATPLCSSQRIHKTLADGKQILPAAPPVLRSLPPAGTADPCNGSRPYHPPSWRPEIILGRIQLAGSLQALPRPQDMDGRPLYLLRLRLPALTQGRGDSTSLLPNPRRPATPLV